MQPELSRKDYREQLTSLPAEALRKWALQHGWLKDASQMPFYWAGSEGLLLCDGMNPPEKDYALEVLARRQDCWPFEIMQELLGN